MIASGVCPVCGDPVNLGVTHLVNGDLPSEVDNLVTTTSGEQMVVDTIELEMHFLTEHPEVVN